MSNTDVDRERATATTAEQDDQLDLDALLHEIAKHLDTDIQRDCELRAVVSAALESPDPDRKHLAIDGYLAREAARTEALHG